MSTTKRISGDYTLVNKGDGLTTGSNVTISTNYLFIDGNLQVGGNSTSVNHTELNITDNSITLNKGETGAGVTLGYAGIYVDRGTQANVALLWNESTDQWTMTNNGTTFYNIATVGSTIANVYADTSPQLSANLNITGKTLFDTVANVSFYASTANSGGSGVYANNSNKTGQELITKNRAIFYSLIF